MNSLGQKHFLLEAIDPKKNTNAGNVGKDQVS
jgi:hypothetical protein